MLQNNNCFSALLDVGCWCWAKSSKMQLNGSHKVNHNNLCVQVRFKVNAMKRKKLSQIHYTHAYDLVLFFYSVSFCCFCSVCTHWTLFSHTFVIILIGSVSLFNAKHFLFRLLFHVSETLSLSIEFFQLIMHQMAFPVCMCARECVSARSNGFVRNAKEA